MKIRRTPHTEPGRHVDNQKTPKTHPKKKKNYGESENFFAKKEEKACENFELGTKGFTFVNCVFLVNSKTISYKMRSFQHFRQALNLGDNKIISTSKRVMAKSIQRKNVFTEREKIRPRT